MKKTLAILSIIAAVAFAGCRNDVYDSLPEPIAKFVSMYYPDPEIGNYLDSGRGYRVDVVGGPTLYFNTDMQWTDINGNGRTLPEMMLYDQLPQKLYDYLVNEELTGRTLRITHTDDIYKACTTRYTLTYDSTTGEITGNSPAIQ